MIRTIRWSAAAAAVLALPGCNDIPFYGANTPVEEARHAAPQQVAIVSAEPGVNPGEPLPDIQLAGQSWVASGELYRLPDDILSPAGSVAGQVFYGLTWDEPPHDRLFVPRPGGRWQAYRPLLGMDRTRGSAEQAPGAAAPPDAREDAGH